MKVVYLNVSERKAPEVREIEDSLTVFYDLIDCSTVDMITREIDGSPFTIICDDEGLFVERPIISAMSLTTEERLVGNLIITGAPNDEGELIELTDEEAERILKKIISVYSIDDINNLIYYNKRLILD